MNSNEEEFNKVFYRVIENQKIDLEYFKNQIDETKESTANFLKGKKQNKTRLFGMLPQIFPSRIRRKL
jgi:hypothetical protein